jgi:hypothetical protein
MRDQDSNQEENWRRYVVVSGLFFLCINIVIIGFNAYVDPLNRLAHLQLPRLEIDRDPSTGGRAKTASGLLAGDINALMLGSSRVEVGLDPEHPLFDGFHAYDASLRGTNLYEISRVYDFALEHNDIELVVYGVDFLTFSTRRTVRADYYESAFHTEAMLVTARYLASIDSLNQSFGALASDPQHLAKRGRKEFGYSSSDNASYDQRQVFKEVLLTNFITNPLTYGEFEYGSDRLAMFREMLEESARRGVDLKLFISPVHAWQLETMASMGLLETYNRWQGDLVDIVASVNESMGSSFVLWDFSGYNEITTESVPAVGERGKRMTWYRDSSHYREEVGDMVLSRMAPRDQSPRLQSDFGEILSPETMSAYTSRFMEARDRYRSSHKDAVAEIADMVRLSGEQASRESDRLPSG